MSEENVEIIKRAIERWNKGEPIPDEEIHPDAEIVSRLMGGGSFHGGRAPALSSERSMSTSTSGL